MGHKLTLQELIDLSRLLEKVEYIAGRDDRETTISKRDYKNLRTIHNKALKNLGEEYMRVFSDAADNSPHPMLARVIDVSARRG